MFVETILIYCIVLILAHSFMLSAGVEEAQAEHIYDQFLHDHHSDYYHLDDDMID